MVTVVTIKWLVVQVFQSPSPSSRPSHVLKWVFIISSARRARSRNKNCALKRVWGCCPNKHKKHFLVRGNASFKHVGTHMPCLPVLNPHRIQGFLRCVFSELYRKGKIKNDCFSFWHTKYKHLSIVW